MQYDGAHRFVIKIRGSDGIIRSFHQAERTRADAKRAATEDIAGADETVLSVAHDERECPCKRVSA